MNHGSSRTSQFIPGSRAGELIGPACDILRRHISASIVAQQHNRKIHLKNMRQDVPPSFATDENWF